MAERPDIKFSEGAQPDGTLAALGSIQLKMTVPIEDPSQIGKEDHTRALKNVLRAHIAQEVMGWLEEWAPDVLEEYAVKVRSEIVRDPMEMVDYLERHKPETLQDAFARYAQQRERAGGP